MLVNYKEDVEIEYIRVYEYEKRRNAKRKKQLYYIKQKLTGAVCIMVSAASMIILEDATVALFFVPLGLYLMVTRQQIMQFR